MKINPKINWPIFIAAIILSGFFAFVLSYYEVYGAFLFLAALFLFIIIYFIFKNPFIGIILIVFFLPFERIPSVDLGFMDIKINQIIGGITYLYFIYSVLLGKYKIKPFVFTWPLVIFWGALLISILFSGYLPRSLIVFVFVIFTSLLSFIVSQYLDTKQKVDMIVKALFISSIVVVGFSMFQFMGDIVGLPATVTGLDEGYSIAIFGFPRIQAFSQEPLYLGNYLLIPLGVFIALYLGKLKEIPIKRGYLFLIVLALLIVLGLTVSRGAYLAFAVEVVVLFIFMAKKFFSPKIMAAIIIALVLGIGGVFWFLGKGEQDAIENFVRHVTIQDYKSESAEGRVIEAQRALDIAEENPLFGVGLGAYGLAKNNYPDPESIENWDIVNNEYAEIYAESGYLGLGAFIFLIIFILWRSIIAFYATHDKYIKYILAGLLAAFIGTLVQYNFFSTLYIVHIWVLIGLIIAVGNIALSKKNEKV